MKCPCIYSYHGNLQIYLKAIQHHLCRATPCGRQIFWSLLRGVALTEVEYSANFNFGKKNIVEKKKQKKTNPLKKQQQQTQYRTSNCTSALGYIHAQTCYVFT
jgi:hypothetical protein